MSGDLGFFIGEVEVWEDWGFLGMGLGLRV